MPDTGESASATPLAGVARQTGTLVHIRPARREDADAIAEIHNQGIEDRSATFETLPRRRDQVATRIADAGQPVMVAERGGRVIGWAAVTRANDRWTQSGVGEYTIYVDRAARSVGVGVLLLRGLLEEAERRGYWKLVGRIFTTNHSSLALARRCGFYDVGIHRRHGRMGGEWKDVLVVERLLGRAAED
jgi:L-amino acid N-acyltransferase YncA